MCLYSWSKLVRSFCWPLRLCVLLGLLCKHSVIKFGAEITSLVVPRHNIWSCSINSASNWALSGNRWHCGGWGINSPQSLAVEAIRLMNTFRFCFNLCSEPGIRLLITILAVIPANLSIKLLLWFILSSKSDTLPCADVDCILQALQGHVATKISLFFNLWLILWINQKDGSRHPHSSDFH